MVRNDTFLSKKVIPVSSEPMLITTQSAAQWQDGMRTAVQMRGFAPVVMDEPQALGGTDQGPNPMEYVMGALNGCVAVMVNLIAGEMNFRFTDLKLNAHGTIDLRGLMGAPGVCPHFKDARLEVRIQTDEPQDRLAELSAKVQARCPAINLLRDAGIPLQADFVRA